MNAALAFALARGAFAANRVRLALTIACIALGVALGGAVHTIHTSALAEVDRAARTLAGNADLEIRGPRNGFDDALFLDVAARPEVAVASPIAETEAALPGDRGTLRVVGIDPFRAARLQGAFLPHADATAASEAGNLLDPQRLWLTNSAAARLRARAGDRIVLLAGTGETQWKVAGVLAALDDAGDLAVADIASVQWRLGRMGRLTRIDLRLHPGVDARAFAASLALPPGIVASAPSEAAGRAASITRAYRVNLDALALIALATGAFLVFSTLALQAARRREEFALLRALGVTRRGLALVLAIEGGIIGGIGALAGTALGIFASRFALEHLGTDLGAGYFSGSTGVFAPDPVVLGAIGILGIAMAVAGAWWVARAVARIPVAEALRDRTIELPLGGERHGLVAIGLALIGIPLLYVPAWMGLPIAGYAAIAAWLGAAVFAVTPLCRRLLALWPAPTEPTAALAREQVRHLPGHLAASVAGIVLSASLCVAMAIMVHSFRVSFEEWLGGVVGADLYVRSGGGGEAGFFDEDDARRIAALPEVAALETLRFDRLALDADAQPLSLIARPITPRILRGFRATALEAPPGDGVPVWISEAARDLQGWKPGDRVVLPIGGKNMTVKVAGIIRDYARTWGAVIMPIEDYRRATGDARTNDLAVHLAPGVDARRAEAAVRSALKEAPGLFFEEAGEIRRRSLEIFDRSFALTYALEAIAIAIGLAGVTSSFAALAWSRRREFGVLRFLGFRRGEILRMLAVEGAATGALGAAIGLAAGIAISLVLVHVVNRKSFHWTLEVHWPIASLAALVAGTIALCAVGARLSAAFAVRHEAVLAVKDDA